MSPSSHYKTILTFAFMSPNFCLGKGPKLSLPLNAFEGLQAVSGNRPNIVLLDIKLPDRDGFELLQDIRALGPDNGGDVPVIAMTAFGRTADRNRTVAADFQAHLVKPFVPTKLLDAIKSVLKD